jgi:hypothetical protein
MSDTPFLYRQAKQVLLEISSFPPREARAEANRIMEMLRAEPERLTEILIHIGQMVAVQEIERDRQRTEEEWSCFPKLRQVHKQERSKLIEDPDSVWVSWPFSTGRAIFTVSSVGESWGCYTG